MAKPTSYEKLSPEEQRTAIGLPPKPPAKVSWGEQSRTDPKPAPRPAAEWPPKPLTSAEIIRRSC